MLLPKLPTSFIKSFVIILLPLVGFCQKKDKKFLDLDEERFFRFGAKAGVNINKISGKSYNQGFTYNYQAGVFLQFNFSKRFGIQPEVSLVQSTAELSTEASTIYDDLFGGGGQKKVKLNSIEVPVLLNVNVGESKHVKLQAGPCYCATVKQTVDSLKTPNMDIFKKNEWAMIGGIWIQLPVVHFGARYKVGLTKINVDALNKEAWRSQAIQIFLGLTF